MSRHSRGRPVSGVLLLDKPAGLSSNHALQNVRRLYGARKAGHTGTLDPFATGLLPVCLGEACKTAGFMLDSDKTYRAVAHLGAATATGDPEGEVVEECEVPELTRENIEDALKAFVGDIEQIPPMHSALKHEGRALYELARKGMDVERKPRQITIHSLRLIEWTSPELSFEVRCSKGTYVRTLAEDIAKALGSCAHLTALRRLKSGPFDASGMVTPEALAAAAEAGAADALLLPPDAGLADWPVVHIGDDAAAVFGHGNPIEDACSAAGWVRVHGPGGRVLGLAECNERGRLQPRRVFAQEP